MKINYQDLAVVKVKHMDVDVHKDGTVIPDDVLQVGPLYHRPKVSQSYMEGAACGADLGFDEAIIPVALIVGGSLRACQRKACYGS